jgi:hypothetical protein
MKKLAVVAVNRWLSYLFGSLLVMAFVGAAGPVHAAEFFCSSGDVTCLIDAINSANGMPGANVINLEPGRYTLQAVVDELENGLPEITSSIRIQATSEDLSTVIERDPNARRVRMFVVSADGELTLDRITLQGGFRAVILPDSSGPAIGNLGVTKGCSHSRGILFTKVNGSSFLS